MMSQLHFEGDIDNISERQLEYINEVVIKHGCQNSKVSFESVGEPGDNYAASIKRITIAGESESIKLIAKIAPTHVFMREAMHIKLLFRNEHLMYTEVLPKLVQLQKEAGVPEKEQLRYAKCYGCFLEEPNEVIILEDLKASGYRMLDRFLPLSNECVKSVFKYFAMLHSMSYVLRHKEPKTFDKFKNALSDMRTIMFEKDYIQEHMKLLEAETLTILNDEKYTKFMENKITNFLNLPSKVAEDNTDSKFTVIQQGDAWTNNIMFRFKNNLLTDLIVIDYQMSINSNPANDMLYMIFNCTDHDTRLRNFKNWIDYYHLELGKSLSNFNLNVDLIYPRERLDYDLKSCSHFMFVVCVFSSSMLIRKTEDSAKIMDAIKSENMIEEAQQLPISSLDEASITLYRNRIMGIIDTCTEFALL